MHTRQHICTLLLVWSLTDQSTLLRSCRAGQFTWPHFSWAALVLYLCTFFNETDNCLSWISVYLHSKAKVFHFQQNILTLWKAVSNFWGVHSELQIRGVSRNISSLFLNEIICCRYSLAVPSWTAPCKNMASRRQWRPRSASTYNNKHW